MKEHKYKAWDEKKKKLVSVNEIIYETTSLNTKRKDRIKSIFVGGDGCGYWISEEDQDIILFEYVGELDKNGKEIYSGNGVRWLHESDASVDLRTPSFGVVVWKGVDVGYRIETLKTGKTVFVDGFEAVDVFYDYSGRCFSWEELEVVGHTYVDEFSDCCCAPVRVEGSPDFIGDKVEDVDVCTCSYVCTECGKVCDII